MLRPKKDVKMDEFKKYGFKKCKGIPAEQKCYYLCVSKGIKMLFVSPVMFVINDWKDDDPRIHKQANCHYRDQREALDIVYQLIQAGLLESDVIK